MFRGILVLGVFFATLARGAEPEAGKPYGYTDTALLPGTSWHVHDSTRPLTSQATRGPVRLQDHGSAVRFRNIWIRPL